jgi:hypothetical protein
MEMGPPALSLSDFSGSTRLLLFLVGIEDKKLRCAVQEDILPDQHLPPGRDAGREGIDYGP